MVPVERIDPIETQPEADSGDGLAAEGLGLRSPTATHTGKRVSHFRVLEAIGGGGMGMVYKAEDLKLRSPGGPQIPAGRTGGRSCRPETI